jgi:hypothetical protein
VKCLVERSPRRRHLLGEHVDRGLVEGERDEHPALVRRQRLVDRVAERREELRLLGRGGR